MAKRKSRELGRPEDAPEYFNGCKFWKLFEVLESGKQYPQACGLCDGCRYHKHESIVSKGLAEAQSAAATVSLTLTYHDDEKAVWLDYRDISLMMMGLRKAGYKIRKISAGEYGSKNARAHWHLILYFQWNGEHLHQWKQEEIHLTRNGPEGVESWEQRRASEWQNFAPPLQIGNIRSKPAFMRMLENPEILYAPVRMPKEIGKYRQNWKFWPHGKVQAELVSAPRIGNAETQNASVRYVVKYATKDPWRDIKKHQRTPFDDLPEHIKHGTAYGPWNLEGTNERTKWVRGNVYAANLEAALMAEFETDDDVPLYRRLKKNRLNLKATGGLGRDYFEALGGWYARKVGKQDELVKRVFELGPSYRKKHIHAVRSGLRNGNLPKIEKRNRFFMGDTAFRQFARGFNAYALDHYGEETTGPDHVFDTLDTNAKRAGDLNSGEIGLIMWERDFGTPARNANHRATLEAVWAKIPPEDLRGIVPQRLQLFLEENSKLEGWQEKRRLRAQRDKEGAPKNTYTNGETSVVETTKKRFFFEKLLDGEIWYRREIETVEQLELALRGKLPSKEAFAVRIELEGKGDTRKLSELDIRTVRRRIKKRGP